MSHFVLEHLENIINDIKLIKKSDKYNLEHIDINLLEMSIIELKKDLDKNINLDKINTISNTIYELNVNNTLLFTALNYNYATMLAKNAF